MTLLNRSQILGAEDLQHRDVEVEEWGGTVRVRALTGTERDAYEAGIVQIRSDGSRSFTLSNARSRLVALTVIDEDGNRLFSEADIDVLGAKSAQALARVFEVASDLSGLSTEDVEELVAGFEAAPNGSSTSA